MSVLKKAYSIQLVKVHPRIHGVKSQELMKEIMGKIMKCKWGPWGQISTFDDLVLVFDYRFFEFMGSGLDIRQIFV